MRIPLIVAALAVVSACSPSVPDSAAGVGFDDYSQYHAKQQARAVAQTGATPLPPAGAVSNETTTTTPTPSVTTPLSAMTTTATATATQTTPAGESADLAAETQAALAATRRNSGQTPLEANPNNPPPQTVTSSTGISTENDFEAVGNARSIESDAELLARNRAQYQVVQPTSLPARTGDVGPNIVDYALSTRHPIGTKVHTRIGINKAARYEKNCAKYASADRAQKDFLAKGGPRRDRLSLDPDGDGYACNWNPEPFRKAVAG